MAFKFWLRIFLYVFPFAVPFVLLTGSLIYVGESMPLRMVVEMQMGEQPVLYRPRYGNRDLTFKTLSVNTRRPDVVVVGSSHVLQIRSAFFNRNPRTFYNAGAPAWEFAQVEALLNGIEATATPQIVLLGLDHPWFNDAYVGDEFGDEPNDFEQLFLVNRSLLQDVMEGETFDPSFYLERREPGFGGTALGLRAIRDGHGFRNDGSEQYGDFLIAHWLWPQNERQRHLDWLRDGQEMYVRGDVISEAGLAHLDRILSAAQGRGIFVIGFLPPFMPTLYDRMVEGGQHRYALALPAVLQARFEQYGFAFFDYSDGERLGATDDDFFDGWHASERIYLRLHLDIVRALPERLAAYTDVEALAVAEAAATDTFNVFGNQ